MTSARFRMGFLVNPIAGLGGRPGLKGSDDVQRVAGLASHTPDEEIPAYQRALDFLTDLVLPKGVAVTAPGPMGEGVLKKAMSCGGPIFEIIREPGWSKRFGQTTPEDTRRFVQRMVREELDLLVFVGGDGTAVDVAAAAAGKVPILGVPAGVKMFSGVFAESPRVAYSIVRELKPGFATRLVDVVDLDEESYKSGRWNVRALAQARVPEVEGVQVAKGGSLPTEAESAADLVAWFQASYDPATTYVLGAGATVGALKAALGGGTPLGVDAYRDGQFRVVDGGEAELLEVLGTEGPAQVLVSPTHPQGCLLGRGTAQISPDVLRRVGVEHVRIVATPAKLVGLRDVFVDTGDPEIDAAFPDYVRIRTDPQTEKVFKLRRSGRADG